MNIYHLVTEPGTVRFVGVLPDPVERVWAYLTESELRGEWLASGPMDLRVGGRVELSFPTAAPGALVFRPAELAPDRCRKFGAACSVSGRITRCNPPYLLSYIWGEDRGHDTEVVFELMPRHGIVILLSTHRRLDGQAMVTSVASRWRTHLGMLEDQLYGREPRPFWSKHANREARFERRLAANGPTIGPGRTGWRYRSPHRPIPGTSAAPRFLTDYDYLLLSHAPGA